MKQKVLAFDIDGVICHTEGSDYINSKPNKKAIEKINNLYDEGNKIIIFTARFMGRTNNNYKKAYELGYKFTLNQLQSWNLKFNKLILGKPNFDLLIDDKAINYDENWIEEI
jgi:capsule biosynthesis phosphatase